MYLIQWIAQVFILMALLFVAFIIGYGSALKGGKR